MSDWREQEVINETSARDINEWIDGSQREPKCGRRQPVRV